MAVSARPERTTARVPYLFLFLLLVVFIFAERSWTDFTFTSADVGENRGVSSWGVEWIVDMIWDDMNSMSDCVSCLRGTMNNSRSTFGKRLKCILWGIIWIPYAVYYFWSGFGIANGCVGSVRFVGVVVALKRIDSLFTHSIIAFILSFWIFCRYRIRLIICFAHFDVWICVIRNDVLHTVATSVNIIRSFLFLVKRHRMNDMTNYLMVYVYDRSEELIVFLGKRRTLNCLRLYHHSLSFSCQATPMMNEWQPIKS